MNIKTPDQRAAPRRYWHIPALHRIEAWWAKEIERLGGPTLSRERQLLRVMEYLAANPGLEPEDLELCCPGLEDLPPEPRDRSVYSVAGVFCVRPTASAWQHVQDELAADRRERRVKRLKRGRQGP